MPHPDEFIPPMPADLHALPRPKRKRKRKRKGCPAEADEPTLDDLAGRGQLGALVDRLSGREGDTVTGAGKTRLIRKALEAVAADGLGSLMAVALKQMLTFGMTQYAKAEVACRSKIRRDEDRYGDGVDLPEVVVKEDLPRLVGIQHAVTAIAKAAATVRHLERMGGQPATEPRAVVDVPKVVPAMPPDEPGVPTAPIEFCHDGGRMMIPQTPEDEDRLRRCGWEKISDNEWWRVTPVGPHCLAMDSFIIPPGALIRARSSDVPSPVTFPEFGPPVAAAAG